MNVPNPARFALHKLVVAERRPVIDAAKARKDRLQASQLLACLLDQRPGDLWLAMEAAIDYGSEKFLQQLRIGMNRLGREAEPVDANDAGIKGGAISDLVQIFDKLDSGHKGELAQKKTRNHRLKQTEKQRGKKR